MLERTLMKISQTKKDGRQTIGGLLESWGAGEMAQKLRALVVLTDDLGSILSTHMVAHNHQCWGVMPSSGFCRYCTHGVHIHMCRQTFRYTE